MSEKKYPDKMYFPFVLGNGLDSVMVDYSGSMHCDSGHLHIEQHENSICCWEKVSHRTRTRFMVPIAQFPYRITGYDGELYEVGSFSQSFDPYKAVLYTEVEATIIKMNITTFLTSDGLYVERYEVKWADRERRPVIIFIGRRPYYWGANSEIKFPDGYKLSFSKGSEDIVVGEYGFEEVKGSIFIGVRAYEKNKKIEIEGEKSYMKIEDLKKGDIIERYISLMDNTHTNGYEKESEMIVKKALSEGYKSIYTKHILEWKNYQQLTEVEIPDKDMEDIYRKSLWLIKASQYKNGFITEGLYSAFKGGGYTCHWDMLFACRALLTSNQKETVLKLLDYYHLSSHYAKIYAKQINRPGVYFPWVTNWQGKSICFENANEWRNIE